jgi:arylsulfatase A-like enzyme
VVGNEVHEGLVSTVDVAPTLAMLGGADRPESVAGRNLLPLLQGQPVLPGRPANVAEFHDRLLVETERYRAVFQTQERRCLALFDLVADPDERCNLVTQDGPATRKLVRAMRLAAAEALMPLRA